MIRFFLPFMMIVNSLAFAANLETTREVLVFLEPTSESPVILQLGKAEELVFKGARGDFLKIKTRYSIDGWVRRQNLKWVRKVATGSRKQVRDDVVPSRLPRAVKNRSRKIIIEKPPVDDVGTGVRAYDDSEQPEVTVEDIQ